MKDDIRKSAYSVAEAKNRLPELIDRALDGEEVVITRHGNPVAELKSIPKPPRRVSAADAGWLRARRVKLRTGRGDAAAFVGRMRDEDER